MDIDRHDTGWPGHFVEAARCMFRRCTELDNGNGRALRVSTVGAHVPHGADEWVEIGAGRYFETMVFPLDADGEVAHWIELAAWGIGNKPDLADAQHETAVQKMAQLIEGASASEWSDFIRADAWNDEEE